MKSKILLKRTLPIIIALFVVVVVALVATVVTLDKRIPGFSKGVGEEAYLTYTNDGVSITMTKNDVYSLLRDENYGASTTVTQLVRMIDEDLLTNCSKNYLANASESDVIERIEYAILGNTLEDYKENNKDAFELAAKKANKSYSDYLNTKINEAIDDFYEDFLSSNGIQLQENDITFDGENLNVNNTSSAYKYYQLEEAKYLYAREYIEKEYKEDLEEYIEYSKNNEIYEKYTAALARYEEDLAKWKEANKKTRGDKPNKSDYVSIYSVATAPEIASVPTLQESDFESKYGEVNFDKFWAVVISYSSSTVAKDALSQNGVKIEGGKWIDTATNQELSDDEVANKVIALYNQYYQNLGKNELTTASFSADWTDEDSEFYYTASELTSLGIYTQNSTNKAYNYTSGYAYNDELASNIYLIVNRENVKTWSEYLEEQDKEYYETEFYNTYLSELLDDKTTSSYITTALAKLRYDSDLLIYDTTLESVYMNTYTSDYKATKKASSTAVASYKINGKKQEIKVDDLFECLANTQYGVSSFLYKYQYNWMFLEAVNANNELFNKYIDYKAYLNGKSFKKASLDTEMYNEAKEYASNVKSNFKANAYAESDGTGYNKSYGWKNFIHDYYYENYNVELNSEDDLMVFYVYQQLMDEYQAYLTNITLDKWNNTYLMYMAKTATEYMNISAEELVIKMLDASGNTIDPINWTTAQLEAAKALYDEVLAALPKVEESEISTFLSGLETAFDNAPKAINGAYTGDYAYNYTYAAKGGSPITINVSKYKTLGVEVTSTTATFTNSSSDNELTYAARQIWKSLLPELIKGSVVNDVVIYDTTWQPKAYYEIGNGNYLASSNGLVVMIATSATYTTYFKTVGTTTSTSSVKDRIHAEMAAYEELHASDSDYTSFEDLYAEWKKAENKDEIETKILAVFVNKLGMSDVKEFDTIEDFFLTYVNDRQAFIGFPSLQYVLMYLYDESKVDEDDYTSLEDLYDDYEDAVKDNDGLDAIKEKIMNIVNKYINNDSLNVKFNSFNEFLPYFEKYADSDTSSYVKNQVTTWFTTYSTSGSTLIYGDYQSTSYANIAMFKTLLANLDANFTSNEAIKSVMKDLIDTSIENAESGLSYLTIYTNVNKDNVEKLINAVIDYKDFDVNLDVLFTYGDDYKTEKAMFTETIQAFKTFVKSQYNSLDSESKAELLSLATEAGLVD